MAGRLGLPLSVVDPAWITTEFYAGLNRARSHVGSLGVFWLGVDSSGEGNYLLQRAAVFAREQAMRCHFLSVKEGDPFLLWDEVVGSSEQPSLLTGFSSPAFVCVENGFSLPLAWLLERVKALSTAASTHTLILLIPVAHTIRLRFQDWPYLDVPPFAEVPELKRCEVAEALLADAFPGDDARRRQKLARQLIEAGPTSRAELETWVDHFVDLDPQTLRDPWRLPPPIPRLARAPKSIPTAAELRARLTAIMARLREASSAFAAWRGEELVQQIREPPDPFEAHDPTHWFSACVSYVACHAFDAVHGWFVPLLSYRWNGTSGEIEGAPPLPFLETLRGLRTLWQHGLDERQASTRETLRLVEAWCLGACGSPQPKREHYRGLTSKLLAEWDDLTRRLHDVITNAPVCNNRALVEAQLETATRRLPRYRWRELLQEASARFGVELDIERALDRQLPTLQKTLRDATEKGGTLDHLARRAAGDAIAAELARCPLSADDLLEAGFAAGPVLGHAKALVEERWRADPTLDKAQLLAIAHERFTTARGSPDPPARP